MQVKEKSKDKDKLNRYGIKGILLWYLMILISFLALLFFSGKIDWLNAWVYLWVSVIYQTVNMILSIKKNFKAKNYLHFRNHSFIFYVDLIK